MTLFADDTSFARVFQQDERLLYQNDLNEIQNGWL